MKMKLKKIFIYLLLVFGLLTSVNAITTDGGVAYWTADNVYTDSTGNGFTLTNSGSTFTTGILNNSLSFDGTNDYLTRAHNSAFTTTAFSVSFWFYYTRTSTGYILFKDQGGNNNHDFNYPHACDLFFTAKFL